jgi:peptidoglycan hydrolase CwlO-like protein
MDEKDIEHRLTAVEDRSRSNTHRLEKLEESTEAINRMATAVEVMATKQETMNGNINKLTTDVETLKAEPGKRWKFIVEKAIYIIVAAVIGYFLARVGLG